MKRILVIEDDEMVGEMMLNLLHKQGYGAEVVEDGVTGVRRAAEGSPDVVICDMELPAMCGQDVIKALKRDPRTAHIPVVLMSGYPIEGERNAGAAAYLQKPFTLEQMMGIVDGVMSKFYPLRPT